MVRHCVLLLFHTWDKNVCYFNGSSMWCFPSAYIGERLAPIWLWCLGESLASLLPYRQTSKTSDTLDVASSKQHKHRAGRVKNIVPDKVLVFTGVILGHIFVAIPFWNCVFISATYKAYFLNQSEYRENYSDTSVYRHNCTGKSATENDSIGKRKQLVTGFFCSCHLIFWKVKTLSQSRLHRFDQRNDSEYHIKETWTSWLIKGNSSVCISASDSFFFLSSTPQ